MLKYNPHKRYPLLYNAVVRTGLAAMEEMPPLDEVGTNALLPPYSDQMPQFDEERLRGVVIASISIFLHNAMFCKDFPTDKRLSRLFDSAEKKLKRIDANPWIKLMYDHGVQGLCPNPETMGEDIDPVSRVALQLARPDFEKTVPPLIVLFVDWFVAKRKEVEAWHLDRLKCFSE